jgi:hypothetical protein
VPEIYETQARKEYNKIKNLKLADQILLEP